ncbi:phytanoyl-CoA deoxygenase family protein [Hahella chejuensis KCTC 2396]|uniref:Ectoine hydroxylase n=1 Tax=Hahella chejuensis (strain KCTC 2396) TaxID=349521 RepID=Q2SLV9_HAHCH|nr:ectoine hydroxylase [Hahella chejuensis]ABC28365.1 phytanoyl-CoA deoxygenase family protein [Hahella chejuensis KCTC 2396]
MNMILDKAHLTPPDPYPSRKSSEVCILKRCDPVVYSEYDAACPLTQEQVESYDKNGFLMLPEMFTQEEVALLTEEMERMRRNPMIAKRKETITEPESQSVRSIFSVHQLSPLFSRLATDQRLMNIIRFILGDDLYIHQSRLNYKPGYRGKEFNWHSDFETWHVEDGMPRMRALSASITLTENFEYNGPLMLVPGSHQYYIACVDGTPEDNYKSSLKRQEYGVPDDIALSTLVNEGGIVTATGKPGSVILFDCNTMHGSNSNISPFPRSNAFFVYNAWSNRLETPFSDHQPRPEYIASRQATAPLKAGSLTDPS